MARVLFEMAPPCAWLGKTVVSNGRVSLSGCVELVNDLSRKLEQDLIFREPFGSDRPRSCGLHVERPMAANLGRRAGSH